MSQYYFWTVVQGVLGMAYLSEGQIEGFEPARLQKCTSDRPLNLLDALLAELDPSPLAKALLLTLNGKDRGQPALRAEPAVPRILVPGTPKTLKFTPRVEVTNETVPAAEVFSGARLQSFGKHLWSKECFGGLQIFEWLPPDYAPSLRREELPETIDTVVATTRTFDYLGEVFHVDRDPVVVGFGEVSIAELEDRISIGDHRVKGEFESVLKHQRMRRRCRRKVRETLQPLLLAVEAGLRKKREREALQRWIREECKETLLPDFLKKPLQALSAAHVEPEICYWPELQRDIYLRIKEMTTACAAV